jgi:epoxide hydrolase-like predicted phosphatase
MHGYHRSVTYIMSIQAVIFDFGDVLMRNSERRSRREWERQLGLEEGELDVIVFQSETMRRLMIGQGSLDDLWQEVAARLSLAPHDAHQLQSDFWHGGRLDEEIVEYVRGLRPQYRTAILSDAWQGIRQFFVEILGLDEVFDEIIISAEEGIAKPDRRIYEIALKRLQVEPNEAIFVDDRPANVEGAQALGMYGILFTNTADVLSQIDGLLARDGES